MAQMGDASSHGPLAIYATAMDRRDARLAVGALSGDEMLTTDTTDEEAAMPLAEEAERRCCVDRVRRDKRGLRRLLPSVRPTPKS